MTVSLGITPASDATIIDNWEVAGMRGTASNDIAVVDAFVPEHRTEYAVDVLNGRGSGSRLHSNPLYSVPMLPLILGEVMPVVVGAYRGAADEFVRMTGQRLHTNSLTKVAAKQTSQIRVGRAVAGAAVAEAMLEDYIAMLTEPDIGYLQDPLNRAQIKTRAAIITDFCCNGINDLMLGAGANAYRNSSPLQRFFRDLNMLHVHAYLDLESASETYVRMLLGMAPEQPI